MIRSLLLALTMIFIPIVGAAETLRVSNERFSIDENYDALARRMFGPEFKLADWQQIKERYAREGGSFLRNAGLVRRDEDGPSSGSVTVEGQRFHRGGDRQYFVAWGDVPPSFLVHDRSMYNGIPLNLGSWYTDRRILAMARGNATIPDASDYNMRGLLDALRTGLTGMNFAEGTTSINFVTGAAEISVAVRDNDPEAVRQKLAETVTSFMPVAMRGATNVLGLISEPVMIDTELKVRVTLPFQFLQTGDPKALDCGQDNPECRF